MIARRTLLIALGAGSLAAPIAIRAQALQAGKVSRVAWLTPTRAENPRWFNDALKQSLGDLGYIEGKNLVLNAYYADDNADRLDSLAVEIAASKPDVIVAVSTAALRALQRATKTIPIVMAAIADPVGSGFVTSLARPGGNITGLANLTIDLSAKTIELLLEIVPKAVRIAVLSTDNPTHPAQIKAIQEVAKARGLTVLPVAAASVADIDGTFAKLAKQRPQALMVLADAMLLGGRQRIADLAVKQKLPSIYQFGGHADAGGLISYGPSVADLTRRAAIYVDKILKGIKPADIPIEQPMAFELVINMKTAKALGLKIPQAVLLRADRMIE